MRATLSLLFGVALAGAQLFLGYQVITLILVLLGVMD